MPGYSATAVRDLRVAAVYTTHVTNRTYMHCELRTIV